MKKFISFSGGIESTAMCVLYGKGATAIWCDTGAEPPQMYDRIDYCEKKLLEIHDGDFALHRIRASVMAKGKVVDSLIDYILQYGYMPSPTKRFCTKEFKVRPIDKFLKDQEDCVLMIGFNIDESGRTGNMEMMGNVNYNYPLIENELSRKDCKEILEKFDLLPELPFWMNRGGCYMCFYQNLSQLKATYFFDRETFVQIRNLEEAVNDKNKDRKRPYPLFLGIGKFVSDIEKECERELLMWGKEEVLNTYKKIGNIEPCGAFCHR